MTEKEIFDISEKDSNLAINYWSKWKKFDKKNVWFIENATVCNKLES